MEEHFINYNQSLALKKLGFVDQCFGGYEDIENGKLWIGNIQGNEQFNRDFYILAPLKQQVFKWFKNKHGLHSSCGTTNDSNESINGYVISKFIDNERQRLYVDWEVGSFEEAESACIDKLIELIKQKL